MQVFDVISKSDMVVLLISDAAQVRSAAQHGKVQRGTARCSTAWHSTALRSLAQRRTRPQQPAGWAPG